MESFEELGVPGELAGALAAEGIERPTSLQRDLIPLLRRGNNALARAGPGSGTLAAYGVPLLERVELGRPVPKAAVLTASRTAAAALAESLARLASATGHAVAALGTTWASPEKSDILFATPADLLAAVRTSRLRMENLAALVVDGAAAIQRTDGLDDLETLIAFVPATAQRVVVSLPLTAEVESFARAHARKAGFVSGAAAPMDPKAAPARGVLRYRVSRKDDACIVRTVAEILEAGARHVLVHCGSDDRAADAGDLLSLHGFAAGAPGDPSTPVWLGSQVDGDRPSIPDGTTDKGGVATLSVDVPPEADVLHGRHGLGATAAVLVASRELAHLKAIAAEAGYRLRPLPNPPRGRVSGEPARRRAELLRILEEEDLASEMLLLDPLFERYDPVEVAAAASRLAGRGAKTLPAQRRHGGANQAGGSASGTAMRPAQVSLPVRAQAWVRLFMSVGSRDGIRPGDLLRAVAGEAGIDRSEVGKIEIQDTYARVEVRRRVAEKVVRALNGITLGGRGARVDYHREPARGGGGERGGGGFKPGGGLRRGGGSKPSDGSNRPSGGGANRPGSGSRARGGGSRGGGGSRHGGGSYRGGGGSRPGDGHRHGRGSNRGGGGSKAGRGSRGGGSRGGGAKRVGGGARPGSGSRGGGGSNQAGGAPKPGGANRHGRASKPGGGLRRGGGSKPGGGANRPGRGGANRGQTKRPSRHRK